MFSVKNYKKISGNIPKEVTLVAVTKTKPISDVLEAYKEGLRHFGENRVQDMVSKYEELPKDIKWHMIGHTQRNKIKYMASFVHLIHGVDKFSTLKEINKQAIRHDRTINCLLQIKIASEDTKFGMSKEDAFSILTSKEFLSLQNIKVVGFMGMASFISEKDIIKKEFKHLKEIFDHSLKYTSALFTPTTISMGMSADYELAVEQGSTMIRVGSSLFGERNY